jgi:uncharacterized membrane protein YjgN (DUF898 family)
LVDWWTLTHVVWAAVLTCFVGPFVAVVALTLWEPFEVLVLSQFMARKGFNFGHEDIRNSLVDLVFNILGVLLTTFAVLPFVEAFPVWNLPIPGT